MHIKTDYCRYEEAYKDTDSGDRIIFYRGSNGPWDAHIRLKEPYRCKDLIKIQPCLSGNTINLCTTEAGSTYATDAIGFITCKCIPRNAANILKQIHSALGR